MRGRIDRKWWPLVLAVLVMLLTSGVLLRHKASMAAQVWLASVATSGLHLHDGDLIFQTSRSSQSLAIQTATGSIWSHMGMIVIRNGRPFVLEASATVRYTPLDRWVAFGRGRHFVVKRLAQADKALTPAAIAKLDTVGRVFSGAVMM